VDANNDGDPTNDNEPTPIDITPADFFIPEGFSPDGDGINDLFVVKGLNGRKARIIIYNRWGNKVFGTEGTQISWDGKSSVAAWGSDRLPAATYYYTFELLETKNKVLTGFVVLQY
jgi:gliding motility-associated-like protein